MTLADILLWLAIGLAILYVLYVLFKRFWGEASRYTRTIHGGILETDLRLPFKRFMELYPWSQITYAEYKKLQMDRAFRRAVSSETNKRMVR